MGLIRFDVWDIISTLVDHGLLKCQPCGRDILTFRTVSF